MFRAKLQQVAQVTSGKVNEEVTMCVQSV